MMQLNTGQNAPIHVLLLAAHTVVVSEVALRATNKADDEKVGTISNKGSLSEKVYDWSK
jgi:hypothetical protein